MALLVKVYDDKGRLVIDKSVSDSAAAQAEIDSVAGSKSFEVEEE
tara:strand:- start:1134 stop:1268 length:135 start_codon:yes stop_codon:yes gene_type:complete